MSGPRARPRVRGVLVLLHAVILIAASSPAAARAQGKPGGDQPVRRPADRAVPPQRPGPDAPVEHMAVRRAEPAAGPIGARSRGGSGDGAIHAVGTLVWGLLVGSAMIAWISVRRGPLHRVGIALAQAVDLPRGPWTPLRGAGVRDQPSERPRQRFWVRGTEPAPADVKRGDRTLVRDFAEPVDGARPAGAKAEGGGRTSSPVAARVAPFAAGPMPARSPAGAPGPAQAPGAAPAPAPAPQAEPPDKIRDRERMWPRTSPAVDRLLLAGILAVGAWVRAWHIDAVGLNSDEAVYAGQGASIAGNDDLAPYFPTFRAHPLLFQTVVSIGFKLDIPELFGRLAAGAFGVATIFLTYLLGKLLYGRRAGLIAAALLAVMPYHVLVTRQILLDGPMVFMSTLTLYLLARYATTERRPWFYAAAVGMGLTFLCKESSVILLGSVYTFLALTPAVRTGIRHFVGAGALFVVIISAFPIALSLAGKTGTGGNFLAWQLFRRPNHTWLFYPAVVPVAIGLGVVLAVALGLWLQRRDGSWRETLLLSWIVVPVAFFQLFPVKGFQYLLPVAPAVAVLAGRFFAHWDARSLRAPPPVPFLTGERALRADRAAGRLVALLRHRRTVPVAFGLVLLTLVVPTVQRVQPSRASTFLAGSGGVPGGREAGLWIADHVPEGAQMMSVGPSMANILQYYGRRKVYGLSVSPNPLHRNPVYEPMKNPDRLIRDNELQYVVWDAFSAERSPFFARKVIRYVERYNGHVAHSETVPIRSPDGRSARKPVITIYEVSP